MILPGREQKTLLSTRCPWPDNSVWFARFWTLGPEMAWERKGLKSRGWVDLVCDVTPMSLCYLIKETAIGNDLSPSLLMTKKSKELQGFCLLDSVWILEDVPPHPRKKWWIFRNLQVQLPRLNRPLDNNELDNLYRHDITNVSQRRIKWMSKSVLEITLRLDLSDVVFSTVRGVEFHQLKKHDHQDAVGWREKKASGSPVVLRYSQAVDALILLQSVLQQYLCMKSSFPPIILEDICSESRSWYHDVTQDVTSSRSDDIIAITCAVPRHSWGCLALRRW